MHHHETSHFQASRGFLQPLTASASSHGYQQLARLRSLSLPSRGVRSKTSALTPLPTMSSLAAILPLLFYFFDRRLRVQFLRQHLDRNKLRLLLLQHLSSSPSPLQSHSSKGTATMSLGVFDRSAINADLYDFSDPDQLNRFCEAANLYNAWLMLCPTRTSAEEQTLMALKNILDDDNVFPRVQQSATRLGLMLTDINQ